MDDIQIVVFVVDRCLSGLPRSLLLFDSNILTGDQHCKTLRQWD